MKASALLTLTPGDAFSHHRECRGGQGQVETNQFHTATNLSRRCAVPITLALVLFGLLWWTPLEAATYYVDFVGGSDSNAGTSTSTAWKRIKGMTGVTGTAASANIAGGDAIVFKGGVTWTKSWPWVVVGGSSSMVTYTTDRTWYAGSAWIQPVFDQEAAGTRYNVNAMMSKAGSGWVTINDLKFYRCGVLGVITQAACMYFIRTHNMAITNNTFDSRTWFAIFFNFDAPGAYGNFTIRGNDFSKTTSAVWFASSAAGAHESNLTYTNNTIHDFAPMLGCSNSQGSCAGGGAHGDGFLHYYSVPYEDATQYLDGFTFCNNRSYGDFTRGMGSDHNEDMTAFLYQEGAIKNGLICNNEIGWFPYKNSAGASYIFEAVIDIRDHGNPSNGTMYIVNNTIAGDKASNSGGSAIMVEGPGRGSVVIKNNIFMTGTYCLWSDTSIPINVTTDYNLRWCPNGNLTFTADGGHSIGSMVDPLFVANPGNLQITASSPAIGAGTNLSGLGFSVLNSARNGVARGTRWDIGAYQFSTSTDTLSPAIPQGLRVQ
jgi:hypothetical protein